MSIGKIGTFDVHADNWTMYVERLEQYFVVNQVKDELKVPTLITLIGGEAYELLVNLCTPDKPASKKYAELVKVMSDHLQPRPSMLAERYKFRLRKQEQGEDIATFVAALKRMSRYCDFGEWLDESLRDQFVCGLRSDYIRQRLFVEEKQSFAQAHKLATTLETAEKDSAIVEERGINGGHGARAENQAAGCHSVTTAGSSRRGGGGGPFSGSNRRSGSNGRSGSGGNRQHNVSMNRPFRQRDLAGTSNSCHFDSDRRVRRPAETQQTSRSACVVCGSMQHSGEQCKFRNYSCKVCNEEGHLKRMCPRLKVEMARSSNYVDVNNNTDSDSSVGEVTEVPMFHLELNECTPVHLSLLVDSKWCEFEVDTGSAVTCISHHYYLEQFKNLKLQSTPIVLRYYTGEIVKPIGKIRPTVQYNNYSKELDLYVIQAGKTSLLGRQWLSLLKIQIPVIDYHSVEVGDTSKFNLKMFSSRYAEVFDDGLGRYTGGTVGLHVREGTRPVFMRARPLPYALRGRVEEQLDKLVKDGVLTPVETSDWATPVVPVLKKDGSIRICVDFKITLNKVLEVDRFPVPRVEDVLTKIGKGQKFSKIDLSQAYAQFELDDVSKTYTVINTHKGLFRYNRLVYGLSSSPGIFQRQLEKIFGDLQNVGIFLDDIIITGRNDTEHKQTLDKVFQRLEKNGLKVRKDKCSFFADSVTYLGYVVSARGIQTCPDKVTCIINTPAPQNVSELRAFLGLIMYYSKFIANISTILFPLYNLLKKDVQYTWTDECENAFVNIKNLMGSSKVLAHYSVDQEVILTTDASSVGVGAVLAVKTPEGERPVAYASRTLNTAERAYSQIDKEALAIIYAVRKFHQYLYGRKFILKTDHKALVSIFGDKVGIPIMAASRLQRWAVILMGYNYQVEFVSTKNNCADALSRLPAKIKGEPRQIEETYVNFVENALPVKHDDIRAASEKDSELSKVRGYLRSGWPSKCDEKMKPYFTRRNELYLESGCIMWGYRMLIPEIYRYRILKELHSGHLGIVKTKGVARSYVWWPGIDADVERTCMECAACRAEADSPPHASPQPWYYPPNPWTRLHIDFLGPYEGHTFLIIVDATTKWIEAFHMRRTTATAVIKKLRETFARFGICAEIASDNGPPFSSHEFSEFLKSNGIIHTFCAAYHQSSNGAAENAVKLCKRTMKKARREGVDVEVALQSYLLAYRNAEHSTTGAAPAALLQRRTLRTRLDLLLPDRDAQVRRVQQRQKEAAGGTDRQIWVGENVWARQYRGGEKWARGQIVDRLGTRNYAVQQGTGQIINRHIDQIIRKPRFSSVALPDAELVSPPSPASAANVERSPSSPTAGVSNPTQSPQPTLGTEIRIQPEQPAVQPGTSPPLLQNRAVRSRKAVKRYGFDKV